MMFHDTDQARIDMPLRNSYGLASATSNHDLAQMVWGNNNLVTRNEKNDQRVRFSSGFTHFMDNMTRFEHKGSDNVNPRAVPESDNYGLPSTTTTTNPVQLRNFSNFVKNPSGDVNTRSNKRSAKERDGMIEKVENKKLKAKVVDQSNEFFLPRGDSLVPDEFSTPMVGSMEERRRKMIESADHLVPGPDRSVAASNDAPPAYTFDTIYEEADSAYPESQQWSEEDEDREPTRRTTNYRRNRSSEKKRRNRINKKMRALEMLLPNSNKVDKASVLDEAIEYVKSLQLQLQLLSRGNHMFTSQMMMPQIPMPSLNQFSAAAAAAAMGLGMGMNFGHQFPVSAMHGSPQMPCFPYMQFLGGPLLRSSMAVPESTSIDQVGSAPPISGSNYSSYPNDFTQTGFESELRQK